MCAFSDKSIMTMHRVYARCNKAHNKEKASLLYELLLDRVSLTHLWEIEKLKYDVLKLKP